MARQRKKSIRGGGSVFHRKDDRWEAKFKVEETGRYKSLYAATETEAYKLLEDAKYQQKQGALPTGRDQTVRQFLEYWLEDVEKPTVRLNTYINNRVLVRKHLIPGLGHLRLQKLTASQLQSFYAKKLKEGTSASRIVALNGVLHKALEHARYPLKIIGMNIADGAQLPRIEKYKGPVLEVEQANVLLEKARERNLDVLIALAVVTAMRKGEILGLRWLDIDLVKGKLQISRTLSYRAGYGFFENKPKSKTSERPVMLPRFLVDLLTVYRTRQLERKAAAGSAWLGRDLVFCRDNGDFIVPQTLSRHFYKLLGDVGLQRMHFHDLRHSAATILLSMGVSPNVVQELLGHSNVATTLGIYGHVLPSMCKDALDRMDGLYGS